jgi:hypothetical protein
VILPVATVLSCGTNLTNRQASGLFNSFGLFACNFASAERRMENLLLGRVAPDFAVHHRQPAPSYNHRGTTGLENHHLALRRFRWPSERRRFDCPK